MDARLQEAGSQRELGCRLIAELGDPLVFEKGMRLVESACGGGDAEAAATLATFEAMGAGRPQNWSRALDMLRLAAERGSERAQRQSALLARDTLLGSTLDRGEPIAHGLWARLRDDIDVTALTAAPPKRAISESPRVRVIDGFATEAECEWAVRMAREKMASASVLDPTSGEKANHEGRTNSAMSFNILDMDVVLQVLRARISAVSNLPVPVFEPAQIFRYRVGEEFKPHFDYMDPGSPGGLREIQRFGQRIATFLLYLNDDFEGGETDFPRAHIVHRGRKGDALLFANVDAGMRPDPLTLHAGRPTTRGEKWLLSQWIRDRTHTVA